MNTNRPYYLLVGIFEDSDDGKYELLYGSYVRKDCVEELSYCYDYRKKKIIKLERDTHFAIIEAMGNLNGVK